MNFKSSKHTHKKLQNIEQRDFKICLECSDMIRGNENTFKWIKRCTHCQRESTKYFQIVGQLDFEYTGFGRELTLKGKHKVPSHKSLQLCDWKYFDFFV